MDLVLRVENGGARVAPHPGGPHFVDGHAKEGAGVVALDVFEAAGLEHLFGVVCHVEAHLPFVFLEFRVEHHHRQPPLVACVPVQIQAVFRVGQGFSKTGQSHGPVARLRELFLEVRAEGQFGDVALPVAAARTALVAEPPQIVALVAAEVAVPRDVDAVGPAAVIVLVQIPLPNPAGAHFEVMIHEIASQNARIVTQSVGEPAGGGVEQQRGGGYCAGAHKDHFCEVLAFLQGHRVPDAHAGGPLLAFVIDDFGHHGVGTEGEAAGFCGGGQRAGLGAEIRAKGAP